MTKTAEAVARAVSGFFRAQRQRIRETGVVRRYGTTAELASRLESPLVQCYLAGLRSSRAPKATVEEAANAAAQQSLELARMLNEATGNMLDAGRELGEVFGPDRAALVGLDADRTARQRALGFAAKARGSVLEWETDSKPCEKICRKLNGKRRKPGKAFAIIDGTPIYTAPAHVHCRCRCREVRAS